MMLRKCVSQSGRIQKFFYCTKSKNKFSSTVLLPKTKFPLKIEGKKLLERDENVHKIACFDELYTWQQNHLSEPEFVLHDGPPYANGKPHMGHAINKILKDVILRYHILNGRKIHYIPGWDCHGLPIELKALSENVNVDTISLRTKAKKFAEKAIQQQKEVFQSWGVIGDWENIYTTFSPGYIQNEFIQFYKLFEKGLIFRDVKPIHWSPSTRTALAEAELEYNDNHKSPSAYVRVKLENVPNVDLFKNKSIYAVIWTTTPWTLPSNQLICYNKSLSYSLVKKADPDDANYYIVASNLISDLSKATFCNFQPVGEFSGTILSDVTYTHPVYKDKICKFYHGAHTTNTKGTGLVHTAPAHGPDDFLMALNHKIPIIDLVDENGCYKSEAGTKFSGKFVLEDGTEAVLDHLGEDLLKLGELEHSYPYDWRTKKPVIIKASQQWFIDTASIKKRAIELLEDVKVIPNEIYKKNLLSQVEKRPYWCISRQRKWGVPIPVFYDKTNEKPIIDSETINHICEMLRKHGTDFWWKLSTKDLLPAKYNIENIEKGEDILDIWFDSGLSWSNILKDNKVADMYLEGLDQFTGWFQSSLILSVAIRDKAPYKNIYVHGFAVDENGVKMSKSLGNVIDPVDITKGTKKQKAYGIDTLRWWVACHANQDSLAFVSQNVLQNSADEIQKIRGTLRFAISAISDYQENKKDLQNLLIIDKYMLHLLYKYHEQAKIHIENYEFHKISKSIINLCTNQISALYYTSIKDRLYCDFANSDQRKAAQYTLLKIYKVLTNSIAGIVPHLVEETYMHLPIKEGESYFRNKPIIVEENWENEEIEKVMENILEAKKEVNKILFNSTNESEVVISVPDSIIDNFKNISTISDFESQLSDIFQVAKVTIKSDTIDKISIDIHKSTCFCCPRCRKFNSKNSEELCVRCQNVVNNLTDNKTAVVN